MQKIFVSLFLVIGLVFVSCQNPSSSSDPAPTYSVAYNANGAESGSVPVDATKYTEGTSATVLGNTGSLAKTAYYFNGWNTAADGSGTAYSAGATFTMPASIVTLYAQWSKSPTYTIAYTAPDATGGTIPTDGTRYLAGGSAVVLVGAPTKTDYLLDGWTLSSDGSGTVYEAGDYVTFGDANVTLYAKFLPKHMTFDCYDGCIFFGETPTTAFIRDSYIALHFTFASYGTTTGKFVMTTVGGTVYTGSYTDTGTVTGKRNSGFTGTDTGYTLAFDRGYTVAVIIKKSFRTSDGLFIYGISYSNVVYVSGNETTYNTDFAATRATTAGQWTPYNVTTY